METTACIALSRQMSLCRHMDVIALNIARRTASGFEAEALRYEPVVSDAGPGQRLACVRDVVARDLRAGAMTSTGNPLDLAFEGPAYFAIDTDQGTRYGRRGQFRLSEGGELVTAAGEPVLDEGGAPLALRLDAGPITVAADGTVSTVQGVVGRIGPVDLGQLETTIFANEGRPGGDRQKPADRGAGVRSGGNRHARQRRLRRAAPGLIESSNVNPVAGITVLIIAQRAYNLDSNVITASDEMMATVTQLR